MVKAYSWLEDAFWKTDEKSEPALFVRSIECLAAETANAKWPVRLFQSYIYVSQIKSTETVRWAEEHGLSDWIRSQLCDSMDVPRNKRYRLYSLIDSPNWREHHAILDNIGVRVMEAYIAGKMAKKYNVKPCEIRITHLAVRRADAFANQKNSNDSERDEKEQLALNNHFGMLSDMGGMMGFVGNFRLKGIFFGFFFVLHDCHE